MHFRADYISAYKKASHLCVGDEAWGRITNNNAWRLRVLSFWSEHKYLPESDFYLGYTVHILSDILQNESIYMPFQKKYPETPRYDPGPDYGRENMLVDFALYDASSAREAIWSYLESAYAQGAEGLTGRDEVEGLRRNILHRQYSGERPLFDDSAHRYFHMADALAFIRNCTRVIRDTATAMV